MLVISFALSTKSIKTSSRTLFFSYSWQKDWFSFWQIKSTWTKNIVIWNFVKRIRHRCGKTPLPKMLRHDIPAWKSGYMINELNLGWVWTYTIFGPLGPLSHRQLRMGDALNPKFQSYSIEVTKGTHTLKLAYSSKKKMKGLTKPLGWMPCKIYTPWRIYH
jgi:hypothetical protein